ncbi:MAG TPA: DnaJ domain-containing protein, partial [Burkholderiales bacterium]|nr:DnaJ domain-containing protein [Burkholderiales bacterium]
MKYKDYYEIMGVERTAGPDDIKRAYRKLARKYHPDVSKEPDADHRFREIVEAYEVLSNSERRELYDRFGHAGLR